MQRGSERVARDEEIRLTRLRLFLALGSIAFVVAALLALTLFSFRQRQA